MINKNTVAEVVKQLCQWQKKHHLRDEQIDELLRWLQKPEENQPFQPFKSSLNAVAKGYKEVCD